MRPEPTGGVPDSTSFAQALSTLKEEGSNILVVGTDAGRAQAASCERLLGGNEEPTRYRLRVLTGSDDPDGAATLLEGDRDRVVRFDMDLRDRTSTSPEGGLGSSSLGAFGGAVIETINAMHHEAGSFEPGEFRVCVHTLDQLLGSHDDQAVFRLVHMLGSRIRQLDGMGHFHLSAPRDDDHVQVMEPLFDAIVEVRIQEGSPEQRWELRGGAHRSEWLAI